MRSFTISCFGLLFACVVSAQEVPRFAFDIAGGFTQPVGNTSRQLDTGWNIQAGVGFNFSQWVGVMLQADYNRFGINGATLNSAGFPDGDLNVFSATLDPIVHLTPRSHVDVYLIGGGGLYHRTQEFTQPSFATFTGYNPFFGLLKFSPPTR
jgi:Outer membrane protein beta-barrel domain